MQFQAKANVYTAAGDKAGVVDRVVIDPRNRQVTHVIVQKGLLFRSDKVVPVDMVAEADADRVVLKPEVGEPDGLPDFTQEHYVQMDNAEWMAPPLMGGVTAPLGAGAALAPLLFYPFASAGIAAATPRHPQPQCETWGRGGRSSVEVERNIPEDTVPLKEGARVVAADGQHVGHVERVFTESQTNEVTHLLISQGLFLKERKLIPMAWVLDVAEDHVRLAVGSNLLQGLRAYSD